MATYYGKLTSSYTVTFANLTFTITWANPIYDPFNFAGEGLILQAITSDLFVIGHDECLVTLDWNRCTSPTGVNRDALIAAIIALRAGSVGTVVATTVTATTVIADTGEFDTITSRSPNTDVSIDGKGAGTVIFPSGFKTNSVTTASGNDISLTSKNLTSVGTIAGTTITASTALQSDTLSSLSTDTSLTLTGNGTGIVRVGDQLSVDSVTSGVAEIDFNGKSIGDILNVATEQLLATDSIDTPTIYVDTIDAESGSAVTFGGFLTSVNVSSGVVLSTDSITSPGAAIALNAKNLTGAGTITANKLRTYASNGSSDNPVVVLNMNNKHMSRSEHIETVQTTDATLTTLFAYTPAADDVVLVKAVVVGKNATVHGVAFELNAVYYRMGGTTTLGSAVVAKISHNTAAATTDAALVISSPDILVRVTGVAATTYTWDVLFTAYTNGPAITS